MNNDVVVIRGRHQGIGLECKAWVYFLTVVNKSCIAQDIIVDNGEFYNYTFVWN